MPWKECVTLSLRKEFLDLALLNNCPFSLLCRRFGISRKTGYKWLGRYQSGAGLEDRSRRPHASPHQTAAEIEAEVVKLRQRRTAWGGRTLRHVLGRDGLIAPEDLPAASTITGILRRNGLLDPDEAAKHSAFERYERAQPNELWQMDFKGHFATDAGRCHPLTLLDDHSRYAIGLEACEDERTQSVQLRLTAIFRRYGLPLEILCDNGPPWGTAGTGEEHTELTVWLLRLGIRVLHGRPRHPQTQGKEERFHRTLKAELLGERMRDLEECQARFNRWRPEYNWERPHQALGMEVPGKRYRPSARAFPERLREPEYEAGLEVRRVDKQARIRLWGERWKIGKAFIGQQVAVEATPVDGIWNVRFHGTIIRQLDRRAAQ